MFLQFFLVGLGIVRCTQGLFFVLSDLHYDVFYNQSFGASSYCHNITNAGIPANLTKNLQPVVRPKCDSSLELIIQAIEAMYSINPDPDFILILGDTIGHFTHLCKKVNSIENDECIKEVVFQSYKTIFLLLSRYFPQTQLIPMIGNNDAFEDYKEPQGLEKLEFYSFLYELWGPLVQDLPPVFLEAGYYNTSTRSGFKILVLNSNIFSIKNKATSITEAYAQFDWLESQLISNNKIMILMHISPTMGLYDGGMMYWYEAYIERFVDLIDKYQKNIECIMAGHYHNGIFSLINQVPIIINPSISPLFTGNPQFRLYDWEVQNYKQFTLDSHNYTGRWQVRSFSQEFGYQVDYKRLTHDIETGSVSLETFLEWITGWWIYEDPKFQSMCPPIYGKSCNLTQEELRTITVCQARYQLPQIFELCRSGNIEKLVKKLE